METGSAACRAFILLSCGGEESLKLDGQHNTGAPERFFFFHFPPEIE